MSGSAGIGAAQFRHRHAWQAALILGLLAAWEAAGHGAGGEWISRPSLVLARIGTWVMGDLWINLGTTLLEIVCGTLIGVPLGAAIGVLLGAGGWWGRMLRPLIVLAYSVPMVTMAPLLTMWFGVEMRPKIVLVAMVSFFIVFFYAFSGAQATDPDLQAALRTLGANRSELFRNLVLPSCTSWIIAGIRIALPYALVAAVTGEMLAARRGLGLLIAQGAAQFDLTAVYAALLLLAVIGLLLADGFAVVERRLLRWRGT